jgi:O-antigen ligase
MCIILCRKVISKSTSKSIDNLLLIFIVFAILQSIIALAQYFNFIEAKSRYFKLIGGFTSPNTLGAYVSIGFISLFYLAVIRKYRLNYWLVSLTALLLLITIILSNSRSSWVALCFAVIFLFYPIIKQLYVKLNLFFKITLSLVLLLTIFFSTKFLYQIKPESANGRFFAYKITLDKIKEAPLLGHGLFSFDGKYNTHKAQYFSKLERTWEEKKIATYLFTPFNDFLLITFELGFLFTTLVVGFFLLLIFKCKKNKKTRLGFSILLFLAVISFFSASLQIPEFILIGIFAIELILKNGNFKRNKYINSKLPIQKFFILSFSTTILLMASTKLFFITEARKSSRNNNKIAIKKLIFFNEDNLSILLRLGYLFYESNKNVQLFENVFHKNFAPKLGRIIAYHYAKAGEFKKATDIYNYNLNCEPYRYFPKMDLLYIYEKQRKIDSVISLAKEIVDFPIKIPSKKVVEYKNIASEKLKFYTGK